MALCSLCFREVYPDAVEVDWAAPLTRQQRAIVDELQTWQPFFVGLGHAHLRMDANALYAIARIVTAVERAGGEGSRD